MRLYRVLSQDPHVENLVQVPSRSSEAQLKAPSANQVSTSLNCKTVSTLFKSSPRTGCKSTFSFRKIFQNLVQLFSAALTVLRLDTGNSSNVTPQMLS